MRGAESRYQIFSGSDSNQARIDAISSFFDGWRGAAPAVYVSFVMIEVIVAPLPGTMLYLPGGMVFGVFWVAC